MKKKLALLGFGNAGKAFTRLLLEKLDNKRRIRKRRRRNSCFYQIQEAPCVRGGA